jgi:hypothetical protein
MPPPMKLPPGATLVDDSSSMKLPPGATLVQPSAAAPTAPTAPAEQKGFFRSALDASPLPMIGSALMHPGETEMA